MININNEVIEEFNGIDVDGVKFDIEIFPDHRLLFTITNKENELFDDMSMVEIKTEDAYKIYKLLDKYFG